MKVSDLKLVISPQKIKAIDDKLLAGSAVFSPIKMLHLKNKGVTQIIDLRNEETLSTKIAKLLESYYCKLFNIKYIEKSWAKNGIPSENYFNNINSCIKMNGGKVFMHCLHGRHRTGFAIAMYEKEKGIANNNIIKHLIDHGWCKKVDFKNHGTVLKNFIDKFFCN